MKKILIIGSMFTFFLYLFTSMYNHTWNIMEYSNESVFIIGLLFFLGWFYLLLFKYLST